MQTIYATGKENILRNSGPVITCLAYDHAISVQSSYAKLGIHHHCAESKSDSRGCPRSASHAGAPPWKGPGRARTCTRAPEGERSFRGPAGLFSTIRSKPHAHRYLRRQPAPALRGRKEAPKALGAETLRRRAAPQARAGRRRPGLGQGPQLPAWDRAQRPEVRAALTEVQELLHGERGR